VARSGALAEDVRAHRDGRDPLGAPRRIAVDRGRELGRVRPLGARRRDRLHPARPADVFPTLAFGAFLPAIVLGQFTAKVAGGLFWYVVFAAIAYRSESLHEGSPMGLRDFALYVRISSR